MRLFCQVGLGSARSNLIQTDISGMFEGCRKTKDAVGNLGSFTENQRNSYKFERPSIYFAKPTNFSSILFQLRIEEGKNLGNKLLFSIAVQRFIMWRSSLVHPLPKSLDCIREAGDYCLSHRRNRSSIEEGATKRKRIVLWSSHFMIIGMTKKSLEPQRKPLTISL